MAQHQGKDCCRSISFIFSLTKLFLLL